MKLNVTNNLELKPLETQNKKCQTHTQLEITTRGKQLIDLTCMGLTSHISSESEGISAPLGVQSASEASPVFLSVGIKGVIAD